MVPWAGCVFTGWTMVSGHPAVFLPWPRLLGLTALSSGLTSPRLPLPTVAWSQRKEEEFNTKAIDKKKRRGEKLRPCFYVIAN